jgi:hypothetical protein
MAEKEASSYKHCAERQEFVMVSLSWAAEAFAAAFATGEFGGVWMLLPDQTMESIRYDLEHSRGLRTTIVLVEPLYAVAIL